MIKSNYSISVNLYSRKTYIFVIKIKTLRYNIFFGSCFFVKKKLSTVKPRARSYI
ncbi:hypothetical protein [Arsenophonus endosymbiont of Bemisia tabaci]|uniref:hypothetical protein n=1 Tax=Arsenophonus endosymbiont of Bemisia tabaci TaxID=536059 RepID=UPI0015F45E5B|nr:hypothetical protein [Arsenophonus endosymbiont of Bemisia tabaci]